MVEIEKDDLYLVDLLDGKGIRLLVGKDSVKELLAENIEEVRNYFAEVLEREQGEEVEDPPKIVRVRFPNGLFSGGGSSGEKPSIKIMRPTQFAPGDALFGQ